INLIADTIPLKAKKDTVHISYVVERQTGYSDGEKRAIPVRPVGIEKSIGEFFQVKNDTQFVINRSYSGSPIEVSVLNNQMDVLLAEVERLVDYPYDCNEQLASKLKGLLILKQVNNTRNIPFRKEAQIKKIIRLLERNQNSSGLWGWWKNGTDNYWISLHVAEALLLATEAGYPSDINKTNLIGEINWAIQTGNSLSNKIRSLHLLRLLDTTAILNNAIEELEKTARLSSADQLRIDQLKAEINLDVNAEKYLKQLQTTVFEGA